MNTNEPKNNPYRICFVCLGNIVRSPLAENVFRQLTIDNGVGAAYEVDSAGTASYHIGQSPDRRMRKVAAKRGLDYAGSARQFRSADFSRFDLIVPMDTENLSDLQRLAPNEDARGKIHLMRDFDPQANPSASVPDPYYGGIQGFEEVYDIVERSCQDLFAALERGDRP